MSKITDGLKKVGEGVAVALIVTTAAIGSVALDEANERAKVKSGERFNEVLNALAESDISGYYKQEIITMLAGEEIGDQKLMAIKAILSDKTMSGYYKCESIRDILK